MIKREKNYNIYELSEDTLKIVEAANQLIQQDGITNVRVSVFFEYVKKVEDKLWENKNRNYYLHNVPLEGISEDAQVRENVMLSKEISVEEHLSKKDKFVVIRKMLQKCTSVQKSRYLKYHYLQMSIYEIAREESVSEGAVRQSLRRVNSKLKK